MKVKRAFRKALAVLMAVCMAVQLNGISFAAGYEKYSEIIIDCGVDCEKTQLIMNVINGEIPGNSEFMSITPTNILCVFGHSWANTVAMYIEHRHWQNPTRCRRTIYDVKYCTRSGCDRVDMTQTSQSAIICCS